MLIGLQLSNTLIGIYQTNGESQAAVFDNSKALSDCWWYFVKIGFSETIFRKKSQQRHECGDDN